MRDGIGSRCEDDRYARAKHDAGCVRLGEEAEVLACMLPASRSGTEQDLRAPCHRGPDALDPGRLGIDGVVEGGGPSSSAARDCSRSAILRRPPPRWSMGIFEVTVSTAVRVMHAQRAPRPDLG